MPRARRGRITRTLRKRPCTTRRQMRWPCRSAAGRRRAAGRPAPAVPGSAGGCCARPANSSAARKPQATRVSQDTVGATPPLVSIAATTVQPTPCRVRRARPAAGARSAGPSPAAAAPGPPGPARPPSSGPVAPLLQLDGEHRRDASHRTSRPSASRSATRPYPSSSASGSMSSHGASTKARSCARGCGTVSSSASIVLLPVGDQVDVERSAALPARCAPGRTPARRRGALQQRVDRQRGVGQQHDVQERLRSLRARHRLGLVDRRDARRPRRPGCPAVRRRRPAGSPHGRRGCCRATG